MSMQAGVTFINVDFELYMTYSYTQVTYENSFSCIAGFAYPVMQEKEFSEFLKGTLH